MRQQRKEQTTVVAVVGAHSHIPLIDVKGDSLVEFKFTKINYKHEFNQYVTDLIRKYECGGFKDLSELKETIRILGIEFAVSTNKQPDPKQIERLTRLFLKAGEKLTTG